MNETPNPQAIEPMTLRVHARVAPERVMRALTSPDEMTVWLAEHAEVSLPDQYRFWGRYTPDGQSPSQTLIDATETRLRYAWDLDGATTEVDIALEAVDASTLITLRHTGADPMADGSLGMLQTFWAATLANLVDLVEDRQPLPLTDLTSAELRTQTTIDAPAGEVFDSLIDGKKVSAWFGFPTEVTPEVGGQHGFGTIAELDPDRRLSVDYGPMGMATWELEDSDGQTHIVMTQSGFGPDQPPYTAWMGIVSGLAELRRYHELTPWRPIWVTDQ